MVMVIMMLMLHRRHLTEEGCEIMMAFLNLILLLTDQHFRFPVKLSTFVKRCDYEKQYYSSIVKYVSCSKCHATYLLSNNQQERRNNPLCTFIKRKSATGATLESCNTPLYSANKANQLIPVKLYLYNSIIETLQKFFLREGFVNDIKAWKTRKLQKIGHLFEIYDGQVWKTFKIVNSNSSAFVDESDTNLILALNIDWYSCYGWSVYSTGAIYISILNLPLRLRNSRSSLLLVGLMPGEYSIMTGIHTK
jgi:hypothetical protein